MKQIMSEFSLAAEIEFKPMGPEKGEDAFSYSFEREDVHGQGVFDGSGGAGSWQYPEFRNSTGAYVAAQTVAYVFSEWIRTVKAGDFQEPQALAEKWQGQTWGVLQKLKKSVSEMGVSGSLVKSFPCTASVGLMTLHDARSVDVVSLNVGDSRVYYLQPGVGLVQMSSDDTRGHLDAMQSLKQSAPLSDLMNADKPFMIKYRKVTLNLPCAVVCASDGVFGFLRSPMDFEYLLLSMLVRAKSPVEFEESMRKRIQEITGDDSTCIISFYGWSDFSSLKDSLTGRLKAVEKLIQRIDAEKTPQDQEQVMLQIWEEYKKSSVLDSMQG